MNSGFSELGGNWKSKYTKGQRKIKPLVWGLLRTGFLGKKGKGPKVRMAKSKKTKHKQNPTMF